MQKLYKILEIFENYFKQIFEEIAYCFQINFPNHYVSGKNGGGHVPPPSKVKPVKLGGGARASPTDRL